MNKSTFFSGQPIFTQLLKLIPKDAILRIVRDGKADHYCKRFNTYEHLVTILYSIFNNCNSLREVTTGMMASDGELKFLKKFTSVFLRSMLIFYRTAELKARLTNYIF